MQFKQCLSGPSIVLLWAAIASGCGDDGRPSVVNAACDPGEEAAAGRGGLRPIEDDEDPPASGGASGRPSDPPAVNDPAPGPGPVTTMAGVDCPELRNLKADISVAGNIRSGNAPVWKGVVRITADVEAYDTEITIEPGTLILADKGSELLVGSLGPVTINATGTASQPIRFCGAEAGAGFWAGISLGNVTPSSTFQHVLIDGAGSEERALGVGGDVTIRDLRITNSATDGLRATTFAEGSGNWLIEGSGRYPVVFTGVRAVTRFPKTVEFADNANAVALVRYPKLDDEVLIYHDIGIPYLQENDFVVEGYGKSSLTFEAGVEYRVSKGKTFNVTANPNSVSEFKVLGTANAPVQLKGSEPAKGHWRGLSIVSQSTTSEIAHLLVSDAGSGDGYSFHLKARVPLQDVTVTNGARGAMFDVAPGEGSQRFIATKNSGYGLEILPAAFAGLPAGTVVENNELDMIAIRNGTLAPGVAKNFGVAYRGDQLQLDGNLEIEPGTEFVFARGGGFGIGQYMAPALLEAVGTSAKPITFRGEEASNGSWQGVKITNSADPDCQLSFVHIENAGLTLGQPASVTNSRFSGSATYGITKPADDSTDYTDTNTFANNAMGNVSGM